jgi:predicted RND superfamily exporter protein
MSRLLANFIYRWRISLTAAAVAGALLFAPRANITRIDNDITAWFSREDPVYRDYERFREEFAGTRTLIIALEADSPERLFSAETLSYIERVTGDIQRVDTVQRVDSLATATIVDAVPDGLEVRPLIELADKRGPEEVRRRALADDLIRGDLVSDDATVTALIVGFDEDRIDAVRAGVIQRIHDIVDPALPQGVRSHYNGSLEISETYNRITLDNQRKFTPPILLFTVLAIYILFRSARKAALAVVAIGISVLWTLGLYSLAGFTYNVLASMIVPLIVVLAIADDVHIMQHWDDERRRLHASRPERPEPGHPSRTAADSEIVFKNTVAHLAVPLLGASTTTALGMLSLATSDVVAVRSFGVGSAIGIMVDFAISLVVMPTLLTLVEPETREPLHERYLLPPLQRVARWSTRHPGRVFAVCIVVGAVAALGILRLRVDTNHINFFSARHPLGKSAALIDTRLAGVYSYQIMLEGPPDSLVTPDALRRTDLLQEELRKAPHVRKVTSLADYVKRIHKELNDGDDAFAVIPTDGNTIAQELLVFTLGGEGRHELERIAASDYSRAQISIKLQSMSSDLVLQQVERADQRAKEIFAGTGISVLTTGSGRLFSTLDHYLVESQLTSFGTAFLTVFAVIFMVFRSFRFGLLSIVPNTLPVVAVLGVMGYLGISMNIATVMVASVALGVVDDDTVHFINRYRREIAAGAGTDEAIHLATTHEGRASLTTAIINSCGYGVLLLSEYKPTAWFGGLLALTMAVAFLAEVLILPATIKLLPRFFSAEALRRGRGPAMAAAAVLLIISPAAQAQSLPTGHVSVLADYFPNRGDTVEARARLFAEEKLDISPAVRVAASGFVEGLARRPEPAAGAGPPRSDRFVGDAVVRVQDANVGVTAGPVDLLAGFARVAWGRLDEIQPTDVVNPLDISRFFFEGRAEARLPVVVGRARLFLPHGASVEAVYVPFFRQGRFDQLDEPTSPFGLVTTAADMPVVCLEIGCPALPPVVETRQPAVRAANSQGGVRVSATVGRIDLSASVYRGFEPFPLYHATGTAAAGNRLLITGIHPRFTMVGMDFETVAGDWGIRGEAAAFVEDSFQSSGFAVVGGSSIDAGIGVDREAADYQFSATILIRRESYDGPTEPGGDRDRNDVTLVVSADRGFARERHRLRAFAVANVAESSGFARAIWFHELRTNVVLETSAGWMLGEGRDVLGRFSDSDFLSTRLKYYF